MFAQIWRLATSLLTLSGDGHMYWACRRVTAYICNPMDSPYCSCKLTHVLGRAGEGRHRLQLQSPWIIPTQSLRQLYANTGLQLLQSLWRIPTGAVRLAALGRLTAACSPYGGSLLQL